MKTTKLINEESTKNVANSKGHSNSTDQITESTKRESVKPLLSRFFDSLIFDNDVTIENQVVSCYSMSELITTTNRAIVNNALENSLSMSTLFTSDEVTEIRKAIEFAKTETKDFTRYYIEMSEDESESKTKKRGASPCGTCSYGVRTYNMYHRTMSGDNYLHYQSIDSIVRCLRSGCNVYKAMNTIKKASKELSYYLVKVGETMRVAMGCKTIDELKAKYPQVYDSIEQMAKAAQAKDESESND